jgi:hypothetical protein
MGESTTNYRVTIKRPVQGRMRKVGEIVLLTEREAMGELPWGGLELVTAEVPQAEPAAGTEAEDASTRKKGVKS